MNDFKISVTPLSEYDLDDLKVIWQELYARSKPNVFLSWNWIGSWLTTLPSLQHGRVVTLNDFSESDSPTIVAISIFFEKDICRHGIVRSKQWFLHRTGDDQLDQIWIEYNDVLVCSVNEVESTEISSNTLKKVFWGQLFDLSLADEFVIDVASIPNYEPILSDTSHSYTPHLNRQKGFAVDLNNINDDYPRDLSLSTYKQIQRTHKLLEQQAMIKVEVATDANHISELLAQSRHWHIDKWSNTTTPSGFENPYFNNFHASLISTGAVVVISIKQEDVLVGVNYLLKDNDNVYFYLSCLKPQQDNKIKTGLLLHKLSVVWSKNEHFSRYDFLAGELEYKKKLSSDTIEFAHITFQKARCLFKLEHWLKKYKHLMFSK